jgi:membrane protease YdiL (CAAX protease family)
MTSTALNLPRKTVWGFLAFSHGWTWFFWLIAAIWGTTIWQPPALFFFILGGFGVLLGGIVMTRLICGVDGLRELAHRIVDVRRIPGRWWAVILLFFPVLTLLAGVLARAISVTGQPFDLSGVVQHLMQPGSIVTMIAFTLITGPLPEEIGWRGYLLDQVQTRWHVLSAAILVGLLNWIWHYPLFFLPGFSDAFRAIPPSMLQMFFVVVPAGILYAWVYNNTERSVLAAILFHFGGNFWGEFVGLSGEAQTIRMTLTIIAVVFIVWWSGPSTLRRDSLLQSRVLIHQ